MKTALVMMLSLAGLAIAADPKTEPNDPKNNAKQEAPANEIRRMDSVTWDLKTHTLSWVVQKGTEQNGEFVSTGSQKYEVTPDSAQMAVAAEKRGLEQDEAALLHRLLDTLSLYCAQSVVWWDHGEGVPVPETERVPTMKPERPAKQGIKPGDKDDDTTPVPTSRPVKALPLGIAEVAAHPQVH